MRFIHSKSTAPPLFNQSAVNRIRFPILFTRDVNVILRIPLTFDSFFADITRFLGTLIIVLTKTHRSELSHHDIAIR